jgi:chemotaxis protein MotB
MAVLSTSRARSAQGQEVGLPQPASALGVRRTQPEQLVVDTGTTGLGRWLLTYSDMITLLLILFVVLFALSTIEARKFQELHESIANQLGGQVSSTKPAGTGILPHQRALVHPVQAGTPVQPPGAAAQASGSSATAASGPAPAQIAAAVQQALAARGLQGLASVTVERRGVVVNVLADEVYYASDVADLSPEGDQIVDAVASVLATIPNDVVVEGYADNQPIVGGPYTSNLQLSAMRAVNVVLRFINVDHLDKNRFGAIGYGDTRFVASNATPQGRAENRRIDIVILTNGEQAY